MGENAKEIVFQRVHRLGRPRRRLAPNGQPQKPRPVIAGFRDYKVRQDVLSRANFLKGTVFNVNQDFPAKIRLARNKLWTDFCSARAAHKKATIAYPARLIVEGRCVRDEFPGWYTWLGNRQSQGVQNETDRIDQRQRESNTRDIRVDIQPRGSKTGAIINMGHTYDVSGYAPSHGMNTAGPSSMTGGAKGHAQGNVYRPGLQETHHTGHAVTNAINSHAPSHHPPPTNAQFGTVPYHPAPSSLPHETPTTFQPPPQGSQYQGPPPNRVPLHGPQEPPPKDPRPAPPPCCLWLLHQPLHTRLTRWRHQTACQTTPNLPSQWKTLSMKCHLAVELAIPIRTATGWLEVPLVQPRWNSFYGTSKVWVKKTLYKFKDESFLNSLKQSDVILLCETWTNPMMNISIDGYQCHPLHRLKNKPGTKRD